MHAYKLLRVRKDGSIGPLFFDARQRIVTGDWLRAKHGMHKAGFAYRPGWHASVKPIAPHLTEVGRQWFHVEISNFVRYKRPAKQGGLWYIAQYIRLLGPVKNKETHEKDK
jgi:hypothetical protein